MNAVVKLSGLIGLLAGSSLGLGNVQYFSAARSVQASGTVWPMVADMQTNNDVKQSSDFNSFDQTALVNVLVNETVPQAGGTSMRNSLLSYATATQSSSLTQTGISETGSLDYYTDQTYGGNGIADAQSSFAVTFSIDESCDYSLFFTGGMPGETATLADVTTGQTWDEANTFAQGTLLPGEYTLTHDLDYGQVYHDSSLPLDFGLEMNFSALTPVPEPTAMVLMAMGSIYFARRKAR